MSGARFVEVTAFTHRGLMRERNEDAIVVGTWLRNAPMSEAEQLRFELDRPLLCAVADGMGGHAAGDVASRLAVQHLSENAAGLTDADDVVALLRDINARIFAEMDKDPATRRMGTTVVGLVLLHDRVVWFNVGDSRLYRHRNGFLRQISVDDVPAVVRAAADAGARMRLSHQIIQSLGGAPTFQTVEPHVEADELPVPSRWLLCSDGLTDMIDIDGIEACMAGTDREAVDALFECAMRAGGHDNVSLVIVSVVEAEEPPAAEPSADPAADEPAAQEPPGETPSVQEPSAAANGFDLGVVR
jgi:serine/threonine protein phosphatase PrpC